MREHRPVLHITPKKGWINDPNGLVWFKGRYHLYCQHYPFDTKWGPMHWLHFVSDDLLHFEEVGIALKPDHPYDREYGCFSGSSIEIDGKLYVLYTGCSDGKQTQCLAISEDGYSFRKCETNPILGEGNLPEGYLVSDFRDPKIFVQDGRYYALVVSRHKDGYASILLYSGLDLVSLVFVGVVKSFHNLLEDGMVECPDILFDGEKCALIYSLQHPTPEGEKFQSGFPVAYVVGHLDLKTGRFLEEGQEHELDRGTACYATQTLRKDGKNYLVYWQSSWDYEEAPTSNEGYAGQLSLVKEAHIEGEFIKLDFLPGSGQKRITVDVISNQASICIRNLEIRIDKSDNKVTLTCHDGLKEEKRFFHLTNVDRISIEYVYDVSCVELRFQGGEAFASMLDFGPHEAVDVIKLEGCELVD